MGWLVLLFVVLVPNVRPDPGGLDLSFYHTTDTLLDKLTRLADPSRCGQRMWVENLLDEDDPYFRMPVVTFEDSSVRYDQRTAKRILLNFGAHGRELITSEIALRFAEMLCGEADSQFRGEAAASREQISELLRQVTIKIVPVQVASARRLSEVGAASCTKRRLTRHGVDINRNYDVAWEGGDSDTGSSEYRGARAFSEPESRALADLALRWRPDMFVDVHSGDQYLATPFAHISESPGNRTDRAAMRHALRRVVTMFKKQYPSVLQAALTQPNSQHLLPSQPHPLLPPPRSSQPPTRPLPHRFPGPSHLPIPHRPAHGMPSMAPRLSTHRRAVTSPSAPPQA
mgnify:CR=1 FL=1